MDRENKKSESLKLIQKKHLKNKIQERKENLDSIDLNFFQKNNKNNDNVFYNSMIKTPEKKRKIKKKKIGINKRDRKKNFLEFERKNLIEDPFSQIKKKNVKIKYFDFNFENKNLAAFSEIKRKKNNLNLKSAKKNSEPKTIESLRKVSNYNQSKKGSVIKNISSIFSTPIQNSNQKKKQNKIDKKNKIKKNLNSIFEKIEQKKLNPFLVNENDFIDNSPDLNYKFSNNLNLEKNNFFENINKKLFCDKNNQKNDKINCSFLEFSELFKNVDFIQENLFD